MPNFTPTARRFVFSQQKRHLVYERDGDYSMTVCGMLLTDGNHTLQTLRAATNKCQACVEQLRRVSGGKDIGPRQKQRRRQRQRLLGRGKAKL